MIALSLLLACAAPAPAPSQASEAPAQIARPLATEARFVGRVEPANATRMFAPPNWFRIGGWNSSSSNTKLAEIAEDGAEVDEGDVVARFEFRGKDALSMVERRLREAEARAQESAIADELQDADMEVELARRELAAQRAQIDLQRASASSENTKKAREIAARQAAFEAEAIARRIEARGQLGVAKRDFYERRIAEAQHMRDLYDHFERRFVVLAPHGGIVRHAYNARAQRRMQQGDNIMAGVEVLSIAADEQLAARFFVPEARISALSVGDTVAVVALDSGSESEAVVTEIDRFPQEMGFLREDEDLPNAREKAHVVLATVQGRADGLSAGNEVAVRWRAGS